MRHRHNPGVDGSSACLMSASSWMLLAVLTATAVLSLWLAAQVRLSRRRQFVRRAQFPRSAFVALGEKYPELDRRQLALVAQGLRQFFLAYLQSGRQFVAMPSKVVDELWHAFILDTRSYGAFCEQAFGRFFHHAPAASIGKRRELNVGLRRIWWYVCREENIDPRKPLRIPLLFALDAKLGIAGGFHYTLPQLGQLGAAQAAAHASGDGGSSGCGGGETTYSVDVFSDRSIDGSTEGFGDGGGADGGSDGGGGCGGGCGGD